MLGVEYSPLNPAFICHSMKIWRLLINKINNIVVIHGGFGDESSWLDVY